MSKRKHDEIFNFSCLGGDASIDLSKISRVLYEPPRIVFNPEEPELWPVEIIYNNGVQQTFYFDSEASVLEFNENFHRLR